jgi:hypothetical protein
VLEDRNFFFYGWDYGGNFNSFVRLRWRIKFGLNPFFIVIVQLGNRYSFFIVDGNV